MRYSKDKQTHGGSFMNKWIKTLLAALLLIGMLSGCNAEKKEDAPEPETPAVPEVRDLATEHESEFGGVYIVITIDDFNDLGFVYGDSVNVEFSNGYKLEDIPYYNGYYVDAGQPLLIAYPGYDYIKAAINYGEDLWDEAELKAANIKTLWMTAELDEHSTASVTLNEAGKYRAIQEARDIHYYDEREKYPSDVVFANFRSIQMGSIGENVLYRSASPCDNQHNRAPYVNALIEEHQVNAVLDLSDNEKKIEGYLAQPDFASAYWKELYDKGNVLPIALNMNYLSDDFAAKIAQGFIDLSEKEGPYLIHCTEGKDRTGFVCMLVEALCGASYQEIADDYMLTYDNYYQISKTNQADKYQTILESNLDAMLKFVVNDESVDFRKADLAPYARAYLLKTGMTEEQIDAFIARLQ